MAGVYVGVCQACVRTKVKEAHYEAAKECETFEEARLWALERWGEIYRKAATIEPDSYCPIDVWTKIYRKGNIYAQKALSMWIIRARANGEKWKKVKEGIREEV